MGHDKKINDLFNPCIDLLFKTHMPLLENCRRDGSLKIFGSNLFSFDVTRNHFVLPRELPFVEKLVRKTEKVSLSSPTLPQLFFFYIVVFHFHFESFV